MPDSRAKIRRRREAGLCYRCGVRPCWKPDAACLECRDVARVKSKANSASKNAELREHTSMFTARRAEFKRTHPPRLCIRCARTFQPTAGRRRTCEKCWRGDHEVSAALSDRWAS